MGGMASIHERLRDPVLWSDVSQIVKTVVAAVLAWVIARDVLGIAQPFLAPWAALLTVHATVYRTMARGIQQVGATVLGVLLAFAAGSTLGVNAASLGLVLLAGMLAGATRSLRAESTTAAATAPPPAASTGSTTGWASCSRTWRPGCAKAAWTATPRSGRSARATSSTTSTSRGPRCGRRGRAGG